MMVMFFFVKSQSAGVHYWKTVRRVYPRGACDDGEYFRDLLWDLMAHELGTLGLRIWGLRFEV
jgi:hypothetical protein